MTTDLDYIECACGRRFFGCNIFERARKWRDHIDEYHCEWTVPDCDGCAICHCHHHATDEHDQVRHGPSHWDEDDYGTNE